LKGSRGAGGGRAEGQRKLGDGEIGEKKLAYFRLFLASYERANAIRPYFLLKNKE
jgi:hypothetical protein